VSVAEVAAGLAAQLPVASVERLAAHVSGLQGPSGLGLAQAKDLVANANFRSACDTLWAAWKGEPDLPGVAVAAALHAASAAVEAERARLSVELVVTGPNSYKVPLRQTTSVLLELIHGATESVWLVSFAAYKVPEVAAALAAAVDRGVSVRLLLESTEGGLSFDAAPAFAKVADRAAFYRWPLDQRPELERGHASMHAKALVADRRRAFVTSANFTGRALDDNIEVGVLVSGGAAPIALVDHLEALIERKVIVRL
jgi:phosphatidylserine/phosphatidylglycerophosphate/cardiolipin synthase-like enzyme